MTGGDEVIAREKGFMLLDKINQSVFFVVVGDKGYMGSHGVSRWWSGELKRYLKFTGSDSQW
ncbi:hypothetical protein NON20_06710 [Synechocystis sp. B12]|nr:hypothetical protein NON20_06710 [Synechocystis sp. B12]